MNSSDAKWLQWQKTRDDVFGIDCENWNESWGLCFIFGSEQKQSNLFDALLQGKHLHYGLGILNIPGAWKRRRRARHRTKEKKMSREEQFHNYVEHQKTKR